MSEIELRIESRPEGWHQLPTLNTAQQCVVERARTEHLVVRGAPSSGRTTTAIAAIHDAHQRGQTAVLLTPDRVRANLLTPRVQAFLSHVVRPVRTPAAFAFNIVSQWRTQRLRPLQAVELLTGAHQDALLEELITSVDAPWPDSIPEQMRTMPSFRQEIRSFFSRALEAGLDGNNVIEAGHRFGYDQWVGAGHLLNAYMNGDESCVEYPDILKIDVSRIQSLAAEVIESWHDNAEEYAVTSELNIPDVVVVDDLQDCTASTITLLKALEVRGSRIVAFSDSDAAIASYRGGEPHVDRRLCEALNASMMELGDVYQPTQIRSLVQMVSKKITQSGSPQRRQAEAHNPAESLTGDRKEQVSTHLAASSPQLGAIIGRLLRTHHLHEGIPWEEQAVIVRSTAMSEEYSRYLLRAGVPVNQSTTAFNFAAHSVTRILLQLLTATGLNEVELEDLAYTLVTSALIGMDPLDVTLILRRLNTEHETQSEDIPPRISVKSILENPEILDPIHDADVKETFLKASRMWGEKDTGNKQSPRRGLWKLWHAADVATQWRAAALSATPDAHWYDDQLDVVVALMRVGDIWEQRRPSDSAGDFAQSLLNEKVPTDTITQLGVRPPGVSVLTPAQAVGRHFRVVSVLGLQEGSWPDLRLRDRLLHAELLRDYAAGRTGVNNNGEEILIDDPHAARRNVLDDELRLFLVALSRSTQYLHVGAVRTTEDAPSAFFDLIASAAATATHQGDGERWNEDHMRVEEQPLEEAPPPLDLPGQIAYLRSLAAQEEDPGVQESAVRMLALLAREGIPEAHPNRWMGASGTLSCDTPLSGRLVLSPSQFERALECPLKWFLTSVNATTSGQAAQQLGTVVHSLAERNPTGSEGALLEQLEAHFEELGYEPHNWEGQEKIARATQIVELLEQFLTDEATSGEVKEILVEVPVKATIHDVTITGRIDRVEVVEGGVRITDIKTSKPVTKNEAQEHPQLAAYQLAWENLNDPDLREKYGPVVSARLVFLGNGKIDYRYQQALTDEQRHEWIAKLDDFAQNARTTTFTATPSQRACQWCEFESVCPSKERGRRTVE